MDEGPNISGMSNEELKANNLKSLRPNLLRRHFVCVKCKKEPRGWASTAYHSGGGGCIHGALLCHGDQIEVMISFAEAAAFIASSEKIPVFETVNQFPTTRFFDQSDNLLRGPEESGGLILPG